MRVAMTINWVSTAWQKDRKGNVRSHRWEGTAKSGRTYKIFHAPNPKHKTSYTAMTFNGTTVGRGETLASVQFLVEDFLLRAQNDLVLVLEAKALRRGDVIFHVRDVNADGTPQRWKVNGKVKLWKRSPDKVRVPILRGLQQNSYLDESNLSQFV